MSSGDDVPGIKPVRGIQRKQGAGKGLECGQCTLFREMTGTTITCLGTPVFSKIGIGPSNKIKIFCLRMRMLHLGHQNVLLQTQSLTPHLSASGSEPAFIEITGDVHAP